MRFASIGRRDLRHLAWVLGALLCLPCVAAGQDSQSLILRPKVLPPPIPEVQASCAECQPQADDHNRIARQINGLNQELAFRRREVDLQQQAIDLVSAELATLQGQPASADRDARIKFARERLEAYRAQLAREQALVARLEQEIAQLAAQLGAARARLQACEAACVSTAQEPPPPEPPPPEPPPGEPPPQEIPADVRLDLRALRDELTLSDEELERRRRESEQFEASLKAMAGDQWAAEFAAFFTSTLFDSETPFDTAYLQNLKTIRQIEDEMTPEERAALSARALQNVTVAAQRAVQQRAAVAAAGQRLEYAYTREARGLLGPGYPDLPSAGETHKTAALMAQDAHMGQLLQFRAGLNTIKIGDGTVSGGSFVNLSGAESFTRLSQINREIGTLRETGGDAERIAALEAERTRLLTIDGVAASDGLMTARSGLIDGLAGLSADVYYKYWAYLEFKEQLRDTVFTADGTPVYTNFQGTQQEYQAQLARYEQTYLASLGQTPFLGAMVDPLGTGDPVPFWQYLATEKRTAGADQTALTQAIDFLDDASTQVIDQFGTIVTTVPLLDAYGSPVFAPLRVQVITDLSGIYPQITANMALLSSQYDANMAANALTRTATDVAIGFTQIGVGVLVAGSIVFFPVATPALVTIEIGLTAGQVGLEGFRTYYAWQDLQRAERAASAGAGASRIGAKAYEDLFDTQLGTFVMVGALSVPGTAGSIMSLNAAKAELRAAAAAADTPTAGAGAVDTPAVAAATTGSIAAQSVPDIATFKAMRPDEQVAAIKGLPEDARSQLVSQLDRVEKNLFVIAWEKDVVNARMIASVRQDGFWREMIDGNLQPLTAKTRNASDQEILDRLSPYAASRDQIVMDLAAQRHFYDDVVGTDLVGPFTTRALPDGEFPAAGAYTSQMTQAEIEALLAKTGPLTPEEIALKADLLLRGYGRPLDFAPTKNLTQAEIDALMTTADAQALFAKTGPLTPAEEARKAELLVLGYGRGPMDLRQGPRDLGGSPMSQADIDALFAKTGELTPQETALKAALIKHGYGPTLVVPGWNAPATAQPNANPFNPFAAFGPAGEFDSRVGTLGGAGDSGMSGGTEVIPGRARNPNRTALFDEPDLPPETLILEPFTPPAAGLLDLPFDLNRLLQGDPLPLRFWHTGTPWGLKGPRPAKFDLPPPAAATDTAMSTAPLATIVHVDPQPGTAAASATPSAWTPFVIKMFPIGCRYIVSAAPTCDSPTYVLQLQYPQSVATAMGDVLRATPGVVYVEGDELRFVQEVDPYFASRGSWGQAYDDQWTLKQVGLSSTAAVAGAAGGKRVTVAVIDTGVAWNHRDLTPDSVWVNPGEKPANGKDDDGNGYVDDIVGWNFIDRNNLPWDFNGHGTLVAGIIAAGRDNGVGIAGVNPGARIMVLKAVDERGRGPASAIAEAIVYAAANGARVINLSVGGRRLTRTEYLAIEFAHARGAVVVVAAGNEGIDLTDYGPAGLPRALTVTATDTADRRVAESNFGTDIDLAAPGVDVLGPRAIGTDLLAAARARNYRRGANVVGPDAGYIRATGTSFAAPLVSGVASLLIAANPALSAEQVERMLTQSARDIEAPGFDHLTGYGRLDAVAALAADPAFFVEAAISRVEVAQGANGPVARVVGTVDAERFAGARIEIGAGERPAAWKAVLGGPTKPVQEGVLGEIPASAFQGAAVWTVRVIASHANGRTREARYLLRLN